MLPLLGSGGRYILLGQPKPGESVSIANAYHVFDGEGKTIIATQGGRFLPSRDIPRYVRLYQAGKLRLEEQITHRFPRLEEINQALDAVRAGDAGRCIVNMG